MVTFFGCFQIRFNSNPQSFRDVKDGSGPDQQFMDFHKMSLNFSPTCQSVKKHKHFQVFWKWFQLGGGWIYIIHSSDVKSSNLMDIKHKLWAEMYFIRMKTFTKTSRERFIIFLICTVSSPRDNKHTLGFKDVWDSWPPRDPTKTIMIYPNVKCSKHIPVLPLFFLL